MESSMVIKVKYGDALRRFNARIDENEKLDLDIDGLRAKIFSLFNFPPDSDLTLTYIDEDGDIVTLVDDNDLCDVMRQRLKFLRIDVQLKNDEFGKAYARSSGSSTPLRSPRVQQPLPDLNIKVAEVLKSVPEPLRDALSKLSVDFASKASCSSPNFADLVECFSKMGLSHLNQITQWQSCADSSKQAKASENLMVSAVPKESNATKGGGLRDVLPKSTAVNSTYKSSQEVDVANAIRGVGEPFAAISSSVDLNLVPPSDSVAAGSTNVSFPAGADPKDAKEISYYRNGKSAGFVASTSFADPPRPSDVNQAQIMDLGSNLSNECPFSGAPVSNDSAGAYGEPCIRSFRRNINRDAQVGMFHKGVRCDGCGVHPITGPRYKSKVKEDYDLCSICFAAMGNETDYIRMDRPVHHRHPRPFRRLNDHKVWLGNPPHISTPAPPPILGGCGIRPGRFKLDSCFILDVNVLDGTVMAPCTQFTKIWRMRNSGTLAWPQGTQLMWIGGDRFSDTVSAEIEVPAGGLPVEGELDIAIDFTAPELPGSYSSYWRMASPAGVNFGQRVWVLIEVDGSMKDCSCNSLEGLNLNLPPESNSSKGPEIIDMNVQPVTDEGFQEPRNSYAVAEPVKPVVDEQPKNEQELNFPINDSLLVGHGASASAPASTPTSPRAPSTVSYPVVDNHAPPLPQGPSTVSYPIIDLTEADLAQPSHSTLNFTTVPVPTLPELISDKDDAEQFLLKELEEMGFKQVDLNKQILKMNEYDLEQSVDDLCGAAEWEPILIELQEMGFCDEETNRRLLKKNKGSVMRVVMDLLSGGKA